MRTVTNPATAHIVQLTDCHLLADPQTTLRGVNTDQSLVAVINDLAQLTPPPELILATGDLAQDGSLAAYQRLKAYLSELATTVYLIPGNHDDPAVMNQAFAERDAFRYMETVHINSWHIVPLSTVAPGSDRGYVTAQELTRLDGALRQAHGSHVLLAMHHQPVPANMPALDATAVANAGELFAVIDSHEQVRAIVWGHIHRRFEGWRNGVRLLGAPSTCFQFKPEGNKVTVDEVPPGYRRLSLAPDGTVKSSVKFLPRLIQSRS